MNLLNRMIFEEQSEEFKQFFLLAFTRELILNTLGEDSIKELKFEEEIKKETVKERAKEIIKEHNKPLKLSPVQQLQNITEQKFKPLPKPFAVKKVAPRRLVIPQARFPQRLQYIKPTATDVEMSVGTIDQFINDPGVQMIECNGPGEPIVIKTPVEKTTNVTLTKEEIDDIIKKFSEASRIPISEGIFRVAVGRLLFSAIISGVVGSKFIIKKMRVMPKLIARGELK